MLVMAVILVGSDRKGQKDILGRLDSLSSLDSITAFVNFFDW